MSLRSKIGAFLAALGLASAANESEAEKQAIKQRYEPDELQFGRPNAHIPVRFKNQRQKRRDARRANTKVKHAR